MRQDESRLSAAPEDDRGGAGADTGGARGRAGRTGKGVRLIPFGRRRPAGTGRRWSHLRMGAD